MSGALKLQTTPLRQVADVKSLLMNEQARDQLAAVAAKHMNPERMMRVVANAIRTTPALQECEPMSFLGALMHCASLGLEPNTPLGHAYFIPFKNDKKKITEVQVVIGYKGFIDMARRSGQLANIHGDVVYSDDVLFSHEYGTDQHLRHRPGPRKGKLLGAYCYVELNLGQGVTAKGHRYLSVEEIIAHRNTHSQGWKTAVKFGKTAGSPWNEANPQFEAMCIKTAVRAMANRGELPMSIEFMSAMETDEAKADYRAFAMDPTAGMAEPTDDDFIEGEPAATAQIEQQPAGVEPTVTQKPAEREPAPRTAAPKVEQPQKRAEPDPKREEKPTQASMLNDEPSPRDDSQFRQFMADLDEIGADSAADMWRGDLIDMEERKPFVHAEIMKELANARAPAPRTKPTLLENPFAQTFLTDVKDFGFDAALAVHTTALETLQGTDEATFKELMAAAKK